MSNGNGKRLLWVDDEIEFLRAHIMFMEEHGYEVEKATNGDDALSLIKSKSYDLVLLDEQMAGKDGLSTLEEIKEYDQNIPVVMVTKSEEERLMEAALGRNINGYLIKPVNPSQILSVCKSILHSRAIRNNHVTSAYVREYSENKSSLMTNLSHSKWEKIHFSLGKWDNDLAAVSDQGLLETHQNHKREIARKFITFVEENYVQWFGKKGGNPNLCTQSMKRKVVPVLKRGEKACLLVMAGFRVDQWLAIQPLLEPHFKVENAMAWSFLPSEKTNCRVGLFSGQSTREVSLKQPNLWKKMQEEEDRVPYERELIRMNLRINGVDIEDPKIVHLRNAEDGQNLLEELEKHEDAPLVTVVVEFFDMLNALRRESPLMMEIVPDEKGFRELARIWFKSSKLFEVLKTFSEKRRSVILTSDHGTVLVDQPAEVFCQEEKTPNPRVKVGQNISCDERHALFVETPVQYGLPGEVGEVAYAIAKDNYYFVYPNKFQYFVTQFKGQMVGGGLSIEELLVPLVTMTPK
ncbi:MAG TPA: response regulator [Fibrobacteria bacterium]|nr:response regulator [Fibrobacteria bacterium]